MKQKVKVDTLSLFDEQYYADKRLAKNELNAKSYGCKIEDPILFEHKRRKAFWSEFFITLLTCLIFFIAGLVIGVNLAVTVFAY